MKNLPDKYAWLKSLSPLPKTIQQGLALLGVAEIVGRGSNATILGWRDELNLAGVKIAGYSDDDIAWCGLFAAIMAHRAEKAVVKDPLWARNWAKFGVPLGRSDRPSLGDCLVFTRGSGGHVGWYIAEDATAYHVLGGNQSNKVSIARVAKDRLLEARRPFYHVTPATVKPYVVAASGALSKNEA